MDDLECEICGKSFNTNHGLYTHKQKIHNNAPSVVLVKHNKDHGDHWKPSKRKRVPSIDDLEHRPKKQKHKHRDDDSDKIVSDEYSDDEDDDDAELDDMEKSDESDHPLDVSTDEDDDNLPSPSSPVQPPIPSSKLSYKKLYEKCRRECSKIKSRCKKKLAMLDRKHKADWKRHTKELTDELKTKHEADLKRDTRELADKQEAHIAEERGRFRKQMNDLEQAKNLEMDDRIRDIRNEQQATIERLGVEHQDKITELEVECEDKIKVLRTHNTELQEEGDEFTSLSKAIFNCTTLEEIFEIERLVKNHQLDEVAQKHLKTLQKFIFKFIIWNPSYL